MLLAPTVNTVCYDGKGDFMMDQEGRLTRREARARREQNERRSSDLHAMFFALGLDPVLVDTSVPSEIDRTFLDWAAQRRDQRNRR